MNDSMDGKNEKMTDDGCGKMLDANKLQGRRHGSGTQFIQLSSHPAMSVGTVTMPFPLKVVLYCSGKANSFC